MTNQKKCVRIYIPSFIGGVIMKRIISLLIVCVLLVGSVFALCSCSNISESYATKVNEAAKNGEHYTYDKVLEDLGENAVDITLLKSGVIVAVEGCKTLDDIKDRIDDGKTVEGIVVTIALGKATGAVYKAITADDLK
jgi:hypothetical protein